VLNAENCAIAVTKERGDRPVELRGKQHPVFIDTDHGEVAGVVFDRPEGLRIFGYSNDGASMSAVLDGGWSAYGRFKDSNFHDVGSAWAVVDLPGPDGGFFVVSDELITLQSGATASSTTDCGFTNEFSGQQYWGTGISRSSDEAWFGGPSPNRVCHWTRAGGFEPLRLDAGFDGSHGGWSSAGLSPVDGGPLFVGDVSGVFGIDGAEFGAFTDAVSFFSLGDHAWAGYTHADESFYEFTPASGWLVVHDAVFNGNVEAIWASGPDDLWLVGHLQGGVASGVHVYHRGPTGWADLSAGLPPALPQNVVIDHLFGKDRRLVFTGWIPGGGGVAFEVTRPDGGA
jgi:hypothetical protein